MGAVYAAAHVETNRHVALKFMHASFASSANLRKRIRREAVASARVQHPHVIDVYDVLDHGGSIVLVMELLRGEPLSKFFERHRGLTPACLLGIMLPIMRGLRAVHEAQIVHRDLKPDNIFLAQHRDQTLPTPKLLDFGVSKFIENACDTVLTQTGAMVGTPLYMSFEQLSGEKDIDFRTDLYACCAILYEGLAGRPPFVADSLSALAIQMATTTPPDLEELCGPLPDGLAAVIQKGLAKRREDRFQSATELILAVTPYADELQLPGLSSTAPNAQPIGVISVRDAGNASSVDIWNQRSVPPIDVQARLSGASHSSTSLSGHRSTTLWRNRWLGLGALLAVLLVPVALALLTRDSTDTLGQPTATSRQTTTGAKPGSEETSPLAESRAEGNRPAALPSGIDAQPPGNVATSPDTSVQSAHAAAHTDPQVSGHAAQPSPKTARKAKSQPDKTKGNHNSPNGTATNADSARTKGTPLVRPVLRVPTQAQNPLVLSPPANDGRSRAMAEVLNRSGRQHFEARRFGAALADFENAYRTRPSPKYLYNIALTQDRLGLIEAAQTYTRYLDSTPNPKRRQSILRRLRQLQGTRQVDQ